MRNVTICLDDETARWARVKAAEADKSLSRYIAELLARERRPSDEYEKAMDDFFSRPATVLRTDPSVPYPKREELYDRPGLR